MLFNVNYTQHFYKKIKTIKQQVNLFTSTKSSVFRYLFSDTTKWILFLILYINFFNLKDIGHKVTCLYLY